MECEGKVHFKVLFELDSNPQFSILYLHVDLAQIPFDKLAEIQQKVGMKVFHQTLRGAEKKKVATKGLQRKASQDRYDDDNSDEEDDSEEDSEEERRPKNKMDKLRNAMNKEKKERKVIEKRADKNRYDTRNNIAESAYTI